MLNEAESWFVALLIGVKPIGPVSCQFQLVMVWLLILKSLSMIRVGLGHPLVVLAVKFAVIWAEIIWM